jgi:hypothetical protein
MLHRKRTNTCLLWAGFFLVFVFGYAGPTTAQGPYSGTPTGQNYSGDQSDQGPGAMGLPSQQPSQSPGTPTGQNYSGDQSDQGPGAMGTK